MDLTAEDQKMQGHRERRSIRVPESSGAGSWIPKPRPGKPGAGYPRVFWVGHPALLVFDGYVGLERPYDFLSFSRSYGCVRRDGNYSR